MSAKHTYLDTVLQRSKMPGGVIVVSPFHGYHDDGSKYYYLREPISWKPEGEAVGKIEQVDVPKGFVTDFASVPAIFWVVLPKDGAYLHAAIVHDYLYWYQSRSRDAADSILKIGMQELGVAAAKIFAIYRALRLPLVGGASAWSKNDKLKMAGEKRILERFPDDPRVTWGDWKTEQGVFAA